MSPIRSVVVLGGGSAGFLAAARLKTRLNYLDVRVIRSKEIGIIGVGEGTTAVLPKHLHGYLKINPKEFYRRADPIWKLGSRFLWGSRTFFDFTYAQQIDTKYRELSNATGYYCKQGDLSFMGVHSALMSWNNAFLRQPNGQPCSIRMSLTTWRTRNLSVGSNSTI